MQDSIQTVISAAFTSTALTAALAFLFRDWISNRIKHSIQHEYAQKLETHKAELKCQTEIEIAQLKSQLTIAEGERRVRYTKIFEHTAEVLATIFKQLIELKNAANACTEVLGHSHEQQRQSLEAYKNKLNECMAYFLPNRIYIPKRITEKINEFYSVVQTSTLQYSMAMAESHSPYHPEDTFGSLFEKHFETKSQLPALLESLETEFHKLFGIEFKDTTI